MRAGKIWCKSWHCEYCFPIRLKQLQRDAANGNPDKFITLTSRRRPDEMTPDEAAQELVHAWRMIVQRAKREKIWTDPQYVAVFELTQNGWPHLHILIRCEYIAHSWLKARMTEYAESPNVWIKKVYNEQHAAWYVAKYCSKGPERFEGCKRYWRTHGYDLSEGKRDKPLHDHFQGWVTPEHITDRAATFERYGYLVDWDSEHAFTAVPTSIDLYSITRHKHIEQLKQKWKEGRQ